MLDNRNPKTAERTTPANNSSTQFIGYLLGVKGGRNSVLICENVATRFESVYSPVVVLAQTSQNIVRIFKNSAGESVVVKSPANDLKSTDFRTDVGFEQECQWLQEMYDNEIKLFKLAYPENTPYHSFINKSKQITHGEWTYRLIIPFITGVQLDKLVTSINSANDLLAFFLAIALELQRIHALKILHGDINQWNILCHQVGTQYVINFIDFGFAYSMDEPFARITQEYCERFPPERQLVTDRKKRPKPSFKQDIYSFGFMLNALIANATKVVYPRVNFNTSYPGLFSTLQKTQSAAPNARPELDEIITQLRCLPTK